MSRRSLRKAAMLALCLSCSYGLLTEVIGYSAICMASRGHLGSLEAAIPLFVLAYVMWLTWLYSDRLGRIFAPPSLEGSAVVGCAAFRVLCLLKVVVSGSFGLVQVVISPGSYEIYSSRVAPWLWYVRAFLPPIFALLFFFAAPAIARWVIGEVDGGVTWWKRMVRWMEG